MQGRRRHARYLKTVATAKHFAAHSGPEAQRHGFDARVSAHDLADTYLPQFEACVREGHVASVMPAYNRVDGEPCAASPRLLRTILRDEWGFAGYVVCDCGAVDDIYRAHGVASSAEQAAALALRAGTDLSCGDSYRALVGAVKQGLATEAEIDRAVGRLFTARFRARDVRSARARPLGADPRWRSSIRPRTARWPRWRRRSRSCCSRTGLDACRSASACVRSRSSVPPPTTARCCWATTPASRRAR